MSVAADLRRTRARLEALAHEGLDSFAYRRQVIDLLRPVLPFDAAWWWTIDPGSLFFTSGVFEPEPTNHRICSRLHRNEFGGTDVNRFRDLARLPRLAGVLSAATGGRPGTSDRYRNMLQPLGYEHELRLALSEDGLLWGGLALVRTAAAPDFTDADARRVGSLAETLTSGLRIGVVLGSSVERVAHGPGVLILADEDLEVLSVTESAERWLDELAGDSFGLPEPVRSVAAYVNGLADGGAGPTGCPRARVRTRGGRWLTIHGSRVRTEAGAPGRTAVILQEASPPEMAPLIVRAYGLTEREASVTRSVLLGRSTKEMAAEMHLSPHTVHDHLKAVFAKVEVSSRGELVARLFDQHYWQRFGDGDTPPDADGSMAGLSGP